MSSHGRDRHLCAPYLSKDLDSNTRSSISQHRARLKDVITSSALIRIILLFIQNYELKIAIYLMSNK